MDGHPDGVHRSGILGSILRNARPRSSTAAVPINNGSQQDIVSPGGARASPPLPPIPPQSPRPQNLGQMLRRRRSANAVAGEGGNDVTPPPPPSLARRIRLVPHLENSRSLHFEAISRDVKPGDSPLRIGRFTDRSGMTPMAQASNKLAFRSKVVSRGHAEIWLEGGKFYIRDTKSSSGTFLNHVRLSAPNTESRPFALKDGDILQLGVDYQGGTEEVYRCVKMRVEVGREWQTSANAFNANALTTLRALAGVNAKGEKLQAGTKVAGAGDCCICLFGVTVCQALFIAPCGHVFHYKCIRPLLTMHHPGFACPLCRSFADLNADVEFDPPPDQMLALPALEAAPTSVDVEMNNAPLTAAPTPSAERVRSLRRGRSAPQLADETDAGDTDREPDDVPMPLPPPGPPLTVAIESPDEQFGGTLVPGALPSAIAEFGTRIAAMSSVSPDPGSSHVPMDIESDESGDSGTPDSGGTGSGSSKRRRR